jgi:hypothetical protein
MRSDTRVEFKISVLIYKNKSVKYCCCDAVLVHVGRSHGIFFWGVGNSGLCFGKDICLVFPGRLKQSCIFMAKKDLSDQSEMVYVRIETREIEKIHTQHYSFL